MMVTQSPSKHKRPKDERQSTKVIPSKDDLLLQDLPRGSMPAEDTGPAGGTREDTKDTPPQPQPQEPGRARDQKGSLQPVDMETTDAATATPEPDTMVERPSPFAQPREETTPHRDEPKAPPVMPPAMKPSADDTADKPPQAGPMRDSGTTEDDAMPSTRPARAPVAGIARVAGRTLRFGNEAVLTTGQRFDLGGRTYEIKAEEAFQGIFWAKTAGILVLTLLAAIGVAYLFSGGSSPGSIMGVVVNAQTGQIIPNATVSLEDGQVTQTNEAGLYLFKGTDPAQYVISAAAAGFEPQNGFIETEGAEVDQLSFALTPMNFASVQSAADSAEARKTETDIEESTKAPRSSSSRSYGTVELAVDFDGYLVFVDGELYGKNSEAVKRLSVGEHRIVLQLEGYEDYAATVTVKARAKSKLTVAKSDLTPRIDPIKRSRGKFTEGKNYLDQQEWSAAIRLFDEALGYDPDYADALQYRGWAYLKSGNPTAAETDFLAAADRYDQAKKYIDAVACAKYLIELKPKNPDYWRRRADYSLALADYEQAIEDYEKAVKLDKKSLENRLALGEAYFAAGEFKDAAKEFDRARRMADDPSHCYIRMILSYYHAGEIDDVVKKYEDFTEEAPPELVERLRDDPEWLKVLQIVGPEERTKN
jgi:tetratricopeptide (TPR) repeat protein